MIDKKIVVVATGGTIAMKYDPEKDGLVPACTGEDLAAAVPELANVAPLEFIQFSNIASPAMTPQNMWNLHIKLEESWLAMMLPVPSLRTEPIRWKKPVTFWTCFTTVPNPSSQPPPCAAPATPVPTVP